MAAAVFSCPDNMLLSGANLDIQDNQHNTCMHLLLKRAGKMQQLGGAPAITAVSAPTLTTLSSHRRGAGNNRSKHPHTHHIV